MKTEFYVTEAEFAERVRAVRDTVIAGKYDLVTGPGRSGAIAAVYVSHATGIPFMPYKCWISPESKKILVVDTVSMSGKTIRRASRVYDGADTMVFYEADKKIHFWFEVTPKGEV